MYKGIVFMLLSSTCFAIVNIMVKMLSGNDPVIDWMNLDIQKYPPYELVFFRSCISLALSFAIIRAKKIPFFGNNKKWLLFRGIFGASALTLFFYTLQHLPVAIATTVQYLSPLFTVIFAIFINNEKIKPIQLFFIALALIGVVLLGYSKSNQLELPWFWIIMGIISASLSGIAYNAIIKCKHTDAPITVVMYFPLVATPVMLLACIIFGYIIPEGIEWLLLLLIGIFTQFAQLFMTKALHSDTAANVTPMKYVGAIYAVMIGVFIFGEFINYLAYIGIMIILTGVLLNTLYKARKLQQERKNQA